MKVCGPVRVRTVIIAKVGRQFTNLQWPEIANEHRRARLLLLPTGWLRVRNLRRGLRASTGRPISVLTLDASNTGGFLHYRKVTTLATDKKYWLVSGSP